MNMLLTLWKIINPLCLKWIHNESAKQFLSLTVSEQRRLLEDLSQVPMKEPRDKGLHADGQVYRKWSFYFDTIRQHFQLPCTVETRRDRAALLESLCAKDDAILLLGDDDLVSWELAQRGFTAVTASDCDAALLGHIETLCEALPQRPRLIPGDFSDPAFNPGVSPNVVCIDPPYNLRWARIFLHKAMQLTKESEEARLLMMINPHCFGAKEWQVLLDDLNDEGYEWIEHRPRFNTYPLQGMSSILLRWGLRMIGVEGSRGPLYFSSDLFIFKKRALGQLIVKNFHPLETVERMEAGELRLVQV